MLATAAWYLIGGAGALASSAYHDRIDADSLAIWRALRIGARVTIRVRGGAALVDRPVLSTAGLGLAVWLLARPQTTDAAQRAACELIALAERMHSRQDQPVLVQKRATAFAERAVGASVLAAARGRVAALPNLTACAQRLDELLRITRV